MMTFKSVDDLEKLSPSDPAYSIVKKLLNQLAETSPGFDPENDGYLVVLQPGDDFIDLPEMKCLLAEIPWEGVWKEQGWFNGVVLMNNQFGIQFLIPDADWLPRELRESLEENLT